MKKVVLTLFLLLPMIALAATEYLLPGESVEVPTIFACAPGEECPICEECPEPTECPPGGDCVTSPGNGHAVLHSTNAKWNAGAECRQCHQPGGEAVTKGFVTLCSQYNFCTQRGDKDCMQGIQMLNSDGTPLIDPVSGAGVFSGGSVAGYTAGMEVACSDCHYPHNSGVKVEDFMVHEGCLDCHKRVGSGDRR